MYVVPTRRNYDIREDTPLADIARHHAPVGWEAVFERSVSQLSVIDETLQSYVRGGESITPPRHEIFEAFYATPLPNVRVVIIGQDPYTGVTRIGGENYPIACGLSFSARRGAPIPPSLGNVFKELRNTIPGFNYHDGDLSPWTQQGVLLLNRSLTVSRGDNSKSGGHNGIWDPFVKEALCEVVRQRPNVLFVLWGRKAQTFVSSLSVNVKYILKAGHPSPINRSRVGGESDGSSFLGCNHFAKINAFLAYEAEKKTEYESSPIVWTLV
jgi:uracil-DNA glycosylase